MTVSSDSIFKHFWHAALHMYPQTLHCIIFSFAGVQRIHCTAPYFTTHIHASHTFIALQHILAQTYMLRTISTHIFIISVELILCVTLTVTAQQNPRLNAYTWRKYLEVPLLENAGQADISRFWLSFSVLKLTLTLSLFLTLSISLSSYPSVTIFVSI